MLMPDSKGMISNETIYKSTLPHSVTKMIAPLLEELKELNETLDFNEFYDAMEMLMKSLTPGDKSTILLPAKPKQISKEDYTFKPKTNVGQVSVSNFGVYERGIQKQQEILRRIEKEKEIKTEAEMKECKFSPSLMNSHKRVKTSTSINSEF